MWSKFKFGDKVKAKFNGKWYEGVITDNPLIPQLRSMFDVTIIVNKKPLITKEVKIDDYNIKSELK